MEGEVGEVGLETGLKSNGNTNTVVLAEANLGTGTGKPTQPVGDFTSPLVYTCQIEEVEVRKICSQVKLSTVGTKTFLERDLCTITGATTETETDSILSASSETKGKNCHEKYNDFLHNVVDF